MQRIPGLPLQELLCARGVGDQRRRIAGTAGSHDSTDWFSSDLLGSMNDLKNRAALSGTQIHGKRFRSVDQAREGKGVRFSEVVDMDVVADTRAVGRGVVLPKNLQSLSFLACGCQRERDQVCLWIMELAN